jgi:hypothetical protein
MSRTGHIGKMKRSGKVWHMWFRHGGTDRDNGVEEMNGGESQVMTEHILSSKLGFSSRAGMGMGKGAALVIVTNARETASVMERMRMVVVEVYMCM